jgi:hypothetical protein
VEAHFNSLYRAVGRPIDAIGAIEYGSRFGRIHAEALYYVPGPMFRGVQRLISGNWESRDGNGDKGRIQTVEDRLGAAEYVAKYVTKQEGRLIVSRSLRPVLVLGAPHN